MHIFRAGNDIKDEPYICFQKYTAYQDTKLHMHEFVELVYIYSGSGTHVVDNYSYKVHKGCMIFVNYGQKHDFSVEGEMTMMNIMLAPGFISRELVNSENFFDIMALSQFDELKDYVNNDILCIQFYGQELMDIEHICDGMMNEWRNRDVGYRTLIKGYMQIIIAKIIRNLYKNHTGSMMNYKERIPPDIINYIDKNCFEKLNVTKLAERCFYNPAYFGRLFHACFGKSLKAYINDKRMVEAVRLLTETAMNVDEIYLQVGYTNKKQFYKIFGDYTGKTPADIRKSIK